MADASHAGMMRLESRAAAHAWLKVREARALTADSRRVRAGDAFVAWPGHASDGRRFVAAALAAGASACLVEAEGVEAFGFDGDARIGALRGLKAAAGEIASRFLGTPSAALDVVAVTGTNGKTSTAWWIAQALAALGRRCGVIGTLGIGEPPSSGGGRTAPARADRPDDARSGHAAERAARLRRPQVRGLRDRGVVDRHRRAPPRRHARSRSPCSPTSPRTTSTTTATCAPTGRRRRSCSPGRGCRRRWSTSTTPRASSSPHRSPPAASTAGRSRRRGEAARLQAPNVRHGRAGLAFEVVEGDDAGRRRDAADRRLQRRQPARRHRRAARARRSTLADAGAACAALTPVPGRMERVRIDGAASESLPEVVVDYAHTPDALDKALAALRAARQGARRRALVRVRLRRQPRRRPSGR